MENWKITAKEVTQWGIYLISAIIFFTTLNAKVDSVTETMKELKQDRKEEVNKASIEYQALKNQINLQTQQIELIKQDISYMKERYQK